MAANFGSLMTHVDKFLMMTVSLALLVGIVGIINTMLMSTTERFVEFGVLRTNGWSQGNILTLVTSRVPTSGCSPGGRCVLALLGDDRGQPVHVGGVRLEIPPWAVRPGHRAVGRDGDPRRALSRVRAARLVPMDAIRVGSH